MTANAEAGAGATAGAGRGVLAWLRPHLARVHLDLRRHLLPRLGRVLAATSRIPREAAAAGAIGIVALVLAFLAGDGDVEFPGPALEARLLSRPPSQGAEAAEAAAAHAALAPEAFAERLVEDPDFAPLPNARGEALRAGPEPAPVPEAGAQPSADAGGRDPVAVLAGAVPAPADPALRLLEQLRRQTSPRPGADALPTLLHTTVGQTKATAAADRAYEVQLVAVGRREQATEAWARLQRDNADLLGRLQPIIVEPERKVSALFRLRAGPVGSAKEAQALCASLARRAVDCLVVHAGG